METDIYIFLFLAFSAYLLNDKNHFKKKRQEKKRKRNYLDPKVNHIQFINKHKYKHACQEGGPM